MNVFETRGLGTVMLMLKGDLDTCVMRVEDDSLLGILTGKLVKRRTIERITKHIKTAQQMCQRIGLADAEAQIGYSLLHMRWQQNEVNYSALCSELRHVINTILQDLGTRTFLEVKPEFRDHVDNETLFGIEVGKAFPSAAQDIKAAGNCLAADCRVAAVFHLMRIAEVGLWELGRDRQIPCAKTGKIEFTEWGVIIGELEDAVKAIQQWPNSRVKEDAHKFYNSAIVEIRAFNDGWRRHAAHARPYMPEMGLDEAVALRGHVSRFMNVLADKISEGQYTPLVWR